MHMPVRVWLMACLCVRVYACALCVMRTIVYEYECLSKRVNSCVCVRMCNVCVNVCECVNVRNVCVMHKCVNVCV